MHSRQFGGRGFFGFGDIKTAKFPFRPWNIRGEGLVDYNRTRGSYKGTSSHSGGEVMTGGSAIDVPFSTSQKANRIGGSSPREAIATSSYIL